jgi:hypothetical protein
VSFGFAHLAADAGHGRLFLVFACSQAPQLNLKAIDSYGRRCIDADSSLFAAYLEQNDANVVANDDFLTDVTCKDQHGRFSCDFGCDSPEFRAARNATQKTRAPVID